MNNPTCPQCDCVAGCRDNPKACPNVAQPAPSCSDHPDAPHGFDRNASHSAHRYVCDCEGWMPDEESADPLQSMIDTSQELGLYDDAHSNIAQPEQTTTWHPTETAITALKRFEETCSDDEGYDVPKDTMRNLAAIGLIYRTYGDMYCITDFGQHILATNIAQPEQKTEPVTPFGKTRFEHLESSLKWLDSRRERLHHKGCCYHAPSAQCNCGLHQCLTDIRAVINSTKEAIAQQKQTAEPVAWMTQDGRVANNATKQTAMPSSIKLIFNIPLYMRDPLAAIAQPKDKP